VQRGELWFEQRFKTAQAETETGMGTIEFQLAEV
jgi:hypothetical protein